MTAIEREYQVILDRRADRQEGSYTCYLFDQGIHTLVMMANQGITPADIQAELDKRAEKAGNLKKFHQVDKNT